MRHTVLGILVFAIVLMMAASSTTKVSASSLNGSAGQMPTFYDGKLFTINFMEVPSTGEQSLLTFNSAINIIYMCDSCEGAGFHFISVINAIQADGFNPLWQEVQISFNAGFAPLQLTSDNAVLAAAASGMITLTATTEVYRCSVVGTP